MSGNDHALQAADPAERAVRHVAGRSVGSPVDGSLRVTLNFHPDRLTSDGVPLLQRLAEDGVYHSQFVTGTSNGGLTAYPGGDRWRWESRIFGGAYDTEPDASRPVYGALNVRGRSVGGAPRFGSAHLRLNAAALPRATFCYPDSFYEPTTFGVADAATAVVQAVLTGTVDTDPLDGYVEAQVHGPVMLSRDVEALVLDPSFRGTEVETHARRLPVPLEWHPGFRLDVADLRRHPDYRGPEIVDLGARIAENGHLDPRILGAAVAMGLHDAQSLKRVWHHLAHFGTPSTDTGADADSAR
ncbi:hypothetical protein ABH931_004354 [Streptacidiphilus sp. MAP12-33]|uniref:DUF3626 domain-containing protein n=1 Tax=Streptacidiphilus sp. MAP12-33 TaxID=3156266 RepID=UPI0035177ABF